MPQLTRIDSARRTETETVTVVHAPKGEAVTSEQTPSTLSEPRTSVSDQEATESRYQHPGAQTISDDSHSVSHIDDRGPSTPSTGSHPKFFGIGGSSDAGDDSPASSPPTSSTFDADSDRLSISTRESSPDRAYYDTARWEESDQKHSPAYTFDRNPTTPSDTTQPRTPESLPSRHAPQSYTETSAAVHTDDRSVQTSASGGSSVFGPGTSVSNISCSDFVPLQRPPTLPHFARRRVPVTKVTILTSNTFEPVRDPQFVPHFARRDGRTDTVLGSFRHALNLSFDSALVSAARRGPSSSSAVDTTEPYRSGIGRDTTQSSPHTSRRAPGYYDDELDDHPATSILSATTRRSDKISVPGAWYPTPSPSPTLDATFPASSPHVAGVVSATVAANHSISIGAASQQAETDSTAGAPTSALGASTIASDDHSLDPRSSTSSTESIPRTDDFLRRLNGYSGSLPGSASTPRSDTADADASTKDDADDGATSALERWVPPARSPPVDMRRRAKGKRALQSMASSVSRTWQSFVSGTGADASRADNESGFRRRRWRLRDMPGT